MDLPDDGGSNESRLPTYLKLNPTTKKARGRTPGSRSDRAAIVNPSAWNRLHDPQTTSKVDRDHDQTTIVARSWLLFLKQNSSQFTANSEPIHRGIEATIYAHRIAPSTLPRPLQLPTILGLIFPLKTHVVLHCSSTFDRLVKKLSEFRGRS